MDETIEMAARRVRFAAALVDNLILAVFVAPVGYFLFIDFIKVNEQPPIALWLFFVVITLAVFFAINWKLLNKNAQTIGKYAFDVRIVTSDGSKPGLMALSKRYLFYLGAPYLPIIGPLLNLIDILFIFSKEKRCLHDLIANTKVVK